MGTQSRSKGHSLPSDAPQNKRTTQDHPFLSAQWFKGKIKVLNSTKVAVRSRKELERKNGNRNFHQTQSQIALLVSSLMLCRRQSFISSGFTAFPFTPNTSNKHGTWKISSVKDLERERVRRGWVEQQWGVRIIWGPSHSHSDSVGLRWGQNIA